MQDLVSVENDNTLERADRLLEAERNDDIEEMTEVVNEINDLNEASKYDKLNLAFAKEYFSSNDYEGLAENAEKNLNQKHVSPWKKYPAEFIGFASASSSYNALLDFSQAEVYGTGVDEFIVGAAGLIAASVLADKYLAEDEEFDVQEAIGSDDEIYPEPLEEIRKGLEETY